MLSLPLKCVDYAVVDSKQKEGWILVVLCLKLNGLFSAKSTFSKLKKNFMVDQWNTVYEHIITFDLVG